MRAALVANGILQTDARVQQIWQEADLRIAADGGARNARLHLQLAPHVTIGDMDSLDAETAAWLTTNACEFLRHPPAKDETDLELAVQLAQTRGATEIIILGAQGGRADQFLANVLLLTRHTNMRLTDADSEMWVIRAAKEITRAELVGKVGDTVSLIPLDERADGIETQGLAYPLRGETLVRGSTRGISNAMTGECAQVTLAYGTMLIVHLRQ